MIEVLYNRGTDEDPDWGVYSHHKGDKGDSYWLGVRPAGKSQFSRPNVVVPISMWSGLQKKAIDDGIEPESFSSKKSEKKSAKKARSKRAKKNPGISIF